MTLTSMALKIKASPKLHKKAEIKMISAFLFGILFYGTTLRMFRLNILQGLPVLARSNENFY
jgi:hypothetical protein